MTVLAVKYGRPLPQPDLYLSNRPNRGQTIGNKKRCVVVPLAGGRSNVFAYLIILSAALAGLSQAHWWTAAAAGCLLGLLLIGEKAERISAATQTKAIDIPTASASLACGTAAASLAFVVGRSSAWLWGLS